MTALPMTLMTDDEVAGFGRSSGNREGGFGALDSERGRLPLVEMEVDARVIGVIASIEIAQTFVNMLGGPVEATYIFPLPDRAAVHRFRMEVGGRVIEGVVDERGAARERYDEAIAAGHRAAITEEERAGVFTLRVGNLMPGEAATVRLSLVGPLPVDDGEVTFQFPLVVAPRYMPGAALGGDQAGLGTAADTRLVPDASRISPPVLLAGCPNPVRLGIRVALEDHGVRDIASSLHAVTNTLRDAQVIAIQPGERLDRDFILRWRIDAPTAVGELAGTRSSLQCSDDADRAGGTFMLTMVPPSTATVAAKPRDLVFVLDRSGSMAGWKMVAARRATARMIDTLTSRDRFSVLAFDNTVEALPAAGLVEATDRNRYRAVEMLAKLEARGGTELAEPLRTAVQSLAGGYGDRERVVVLVTDGQVGNEDHILRELAGQLRNVRMFTLGIDRAVNAAFLRRLASAGGGLCELVESEDRLDAVMAKVHRRIGMPVATELTFAAHGLDVDLASVSPARLPDVYAGAPVVVLGRYRGTAAADAAIELRGTSLGDPMHVGVARTGAATTTSWLDASWARARIRDLEDQYAAVAGDTLEQQIVALSKRFSVLSRFTAFLAIDRSQIVNAGGRQRQIVQAVDDAFDGAAEQAHSTRDQTRLVAGAVAVGGPTMQHASGMPVARAGGMGPPQALGSAAFQPLANAAPLPAPARSAAPTGSFSPLADLDDQSAASAPPAPRSSTPPGAAAAPPPKSPRQSPPSPQRVMSKASRAAGSVHDEGGSATSPVDASAFLTQLGALARELDGQVKGRVDVAAIRILRQRLTEWIEDVRSVGGLDALAAEVELLVRRLSAALAAGTPPTTEAGAVAAALAQIASRQGLPPGPTVAPPTNSRSAFWK